MFSTYFQSKILEKSKKNFSKIVENFIIFFVENENENFNGFRRKYFRISSKIFEFFQYFPSLLKDIFDEIRKYRKFSNFSNIFEHYSKIFSTKFENIENFRVFPIFMNIIWKYFWQNSKISKTMIFENNIFDFRRKFQSTQLTEYNSSQKTM